MGNHGQELNGASWHWSKRDPLRFLILPYFAGVCDQLPNQGFWGMHKYSRHFESNSCDSIYDEYTKET